MRLRLKLTLSLLLLISAGKPPAPAPPAASEDNIDVYFSPHGGCTSAIIEQINAAKTSIDLQLYTFSSTDIARALGQAQARGVKVRAVLDSVATGTNYSGGKYLLDHGCAVWKDGKHAIAHNKVTVIDGSVLITGSFNLTRQAENSNAENLLIIHDHPKLVAAYLRNFEEHLGHSAKMK